MWGIDSRLIRTKNSNDRCTAVAHCSSVAVSDLASGGPPELLIMMSNWPYCFTVEATRSWMVSFLSRSPANTITSAPVVAIIGYDIDFHEELPWLFPHTDAKSWFEGDAEARKEHAFRNSTLQGAYLMRAEGDRWKIFGGLISYEGTLPDTMTVADLKTLIKTKGKRYVWGRMKRYITVSR